MWAAPAGARGDGVSLCSALHLLAKLKRIDLSGNSISSIDDKALRLLPALRDLILPENKLEALPALPTSIEVLDVRMNRLQSSGIQPEAFRVSQGLASPSTACHPCPQPHRHLALMKYLCPNPALGHESQMSFSFFFLIFCFYLHLFFVAFIPRPSVFVSSVSSERISFSYVQTSCKRPLLV